MINASSVPPDPVAWARRVNSRWIVHGGLNTTAAAYLDHLAAEDPARMIRSCELAHRLVHALEDPVDDPKPWFYAGLFSLATAAEAERFLGEHAFVRAVVQSSGRENSFPPALSSAAPEVRRKIERLRTATARAIGRPEP